MSSHSKEPHKAGDVEQQTRAPQAEGSGPSSFDDISVGEEARTRTSKRRPPSIEIMRDSIESMYSVYNSDPQEIQLDGDGLHTAVPNPVVLTSHWSPERSPTPPRR